MEEAILKELMHLVETTSPKLWEIGVQQAIATGSANLVATGVLVAIAIGLTVLMLTAYKKSQDEDIFFILVPIAMAIAIAIGTGIATIKHYNNPEYYAIEELLEMPQYFDTD